MGYILAIDCGTQSARAIIFDKNGKLLEKQSVAYSPVYLSPEPGWAEKDPNEYFNDIATAVGALSIKDIDGIVLTTQRDTIVIVDKNGEPLRPAILWLDQRLAGTKLDQNLTPLEAASYRLVGMDGASELAMRQSRGYWLAEYEPENWRKTYRYLLLSAYLNYRMTGNYFDGVANTIGHYPFKVQKSDFPKNPGHLNYRQFGAPREKLAEKLVPTGGLLGNLTEQSAAAFGLKPGIPIFAGASDKGAESLAMGLAEETEAAISLGTSASVQILTKRLIEAVTFVPPYPAAKPGYINPEYQVYRGYWLISWFKQEMAHEEVHAAEQRGLSPEDILNEKLAEISPGCDGLMLQPYWTPGLTMKNAKGSIIGFSDEHTHLHIYRAIIEGVNFGLRDGLSGIEKKTGKKVKKLYLAGGGSKSEEICQITADMFGLPVARIQTNEASALGAAIIGYTAIGEFPDLDAATRAMRHVERVYTPDSKRNKIYEKLYKKVYSNIFRSLRPLYKKIDDII